MSSYDTCAWDFGDDTTAPCQAVITSTDAAAPHNVTVSAAHIYGRPGQYVVAITAGNRAGTVDASLPITIHPRVYIPYLKH